MIAEHLSIGARMKKFQVALFAFAATLLSVNVSAKDSIEQRLDRLEAQNRYLSDYIAIWKLQSAYTHYMNINALHDIVALFADSDEQEIELSNKGILRGRDAARRYFLRAGTPQEVKGPTSPRPAGSLVLHTAVNPALEINADGTRAKGVWLSPGITNLRRDGELIAAWNYGKYEMEYVKQKGEWKILAFRWHQMFFTPYDKGWVKESMDPGFGAFVQKPDKPSDASFYDPYRADKTNSFGPPPPKPYGR
jgi:hypothetical protein